MNKFGDYWSFKVKSETGGSFIFSKDEGKDIPFRPFIEGEGGGRCNSLGARERRFLDFGHHLQGLGEKQVGFLSVIVSHDPWEEVRDELLCKLSYSNRTSMVVKLKIDRPLKVEAIPFGHTMLITIGGTFFY
ncbi:hypothetical protein NE237_020946 [Protea cynaroides]|uniref:Uncharacterized protein n=1 Tax=Protea cynaroides TaxID=273540 RepID=A0A9Q0K2T1_9MAGN|nr:hypothetical protein NE237_020946 [Protea cynaroides]